MSKQIQLRVLFTGTLMRFALRGFVMLALMALFLPVYTYTREHLRSVPVQAAAGINKQINFQGKLVNPDGTNVTDGNYSVVFSIYTVASGGSATWTETQTVALSNGIFQVSLGSITALPGSVDFNTDNIYLGIKVGADPEMTPRIRFGAVPQAFNAERLGGLTKDNLIQNSTSLQSSANLYIQSGNTANVTAKIRVLTGQTADVIQVRDSTDTSTVFAVSPTGTITAGTWNGTALTDAYVSDTLTIGSAGNVNWTALSSYPAACSAGQAITALNDTPTCTAFAAGSGSGNYIQNQSASQQPTSSFWISNTGRIDGGLTVAGGASIQGNTTIATTAGNTISLGNSTGALTVTGSNSSTFVLNGTTIDATEFNRLDGKNAPLVDTNDAVATAITGTGTLTAGTWNATAIGAAYGGTGLTSYAVGDMLYASGTTTISKLAAVAVGNCLRSNGVGTAPIWGSCAGTGDIVQNGNSFGAAMTIGTNDANVLNFETANTTRFVIASNASTLTGQGATTITSTGTLNLETTGANAITIGGTNTTGINLNKNVTVAAQQTIRFVGGSTAQRPVSPSEGTLYFDTDTKQLLTYANGKWQGDRSTATKIVAASNSSQTLKDSADYVADGTADEVEINAALTAAAGGKVYLAEGTYTINASILVPNNTTLAGAGQGTLITIPNGFNNTIYGIYAWQNNVVIRDLQLDGNQANQTSGSFRDGVNVYTAATIVNVNSNNWLSSGFSLGGGSHFTLTNNTAQGNTTGFDMSTSSYATLTNNTAQGNTTGFGVSSSSYNTYISNIARNNTYNGFSIWTSSNNTFTGNTTQDNGDDGFHVYTVLSNSTFTGNTIQDNGNDGFVANGAVNNSTFTGNIMLGGQFYLSGGSINNTITGNIIQGDGFALYSSSNNTIANNTIRDSPGSAINISSSDNNIITGNRIIDSGGSAYNNAINISSSDSNTITNNMVSDSSCTSTCIALYIWYDSETNYLADNTLGNGVLSDNNSTTVYGGQLNSSGNFIIQPAGTIELMKNTNITGNLTTTGTITAASTIQGTRLISTVATGTAPLTVASTTLVSNFNADLLDGQHGSYYNDLTNATGTLASARVSGSYTGITGVGTLTAGTWNGNVITAIYGGTGQSGYTIGDLLYASSSTALSKLAAVSAGSCLKSNGVATAPVWGACESPNTILQNGNSFTAAMTIGTNDNYALNFETNNTTRWSISSAGHFLPSADSTYDIGSNTNRVRDLYVSGSTVHIGASTSDEATISYNNATDSLIFKNATNSASAFQIQQGITNGVLFNANTIGQKISIGNATGSDARLHIEGQAGTADMLWTPRSSAPGNQWRSVTHGNGLFVAVSSDVTSPNQVMTSSDGITWTAQTAAQTNSWRSITYGNGLFVAVSSTGTNRVMTSSDGINWTAQTAAQANAWTSITYGSGMFVAVSYDGTNRVMTSPDGINWTPRSAVGNDDGWQSVTYGNGLFVAVSSTGTDRIMTSPDGINWTPRSAVGNDDSWLSITYGNGLFVAVGSGSDYVMTSPDGITWTAQTAAQANQWTSITYGSGMFVAVSSTGTNRVMTSPDGITWTAQTAAQANQWWSITYGNGMFVAVSYDGIKRVMTSGDIALTTRGAIQANGDISATGDIKAKAYSQSAFSIQNTASNSTLFNADTVSGKISIGSATGTNATLHIEGRDKGSEWIARPAAGNNDEWQSITYGNGLFVAVGGSVGDGVMTSPDGINWTPRTVPEANAWNSVTYGNGKFVAVAGNGTNRVMTSPDGITWTPQAAAQANWWYSVTYGNGLFVAVSMGGTNRVMTSPDGITWTPRNAAQANTWMSVTYGNGLFVAVSYDGTNQVMTSPDGINWTPRTASQVTGWTSVTYGNGLFVAVQDYGDSIVMTSPDGITWTTHTLPGLTDQFVSVTYGNGLFVAVSYYSFSTVITSPDGINWTPHESAVTGAYWTSVTYGNGKFVAVSQYEGVMTSGGTALTVNGTTTLDGDITANGVATFKTSSTSGFVIQNGVTNGTLFNANMVNSSISIGTTANPTGARLYVEGQANTNDMVWTERYTSQANQWVSVTYGNGTFVAVSRDGTNRVMTSTNGTVWTVRNAAQANTWNSITYGNGMFVAVSQDGTNRVMTSPDGITWTAQTAAQANQWKSVTYGNGLFVAVSYTGTNRVMTSPDGITWTAQTAAQANTWISVTYGNGVFVAIANTGTNRVMTSPDGITWTAQTAAQANTWISVTYGNGVFVAVSVDGSSRVMTSTNGTAWTTRTAAQANLWSSVTYANGMFVAVSADGTNQVMTSTNGAGWTSRTATQANAWNSVAYGNGMFVAVASSGNSYRVMTSGDIALSARGAAQFNGDVTATGDVVAKANSTTAFTIQNSVTGNVLFNADTVNGRISIGSNVATNATLHVEGRDKGSAWTTATSTSSLTWHSSVTYGNGLFVAVSKSGTNRVMTSTDGKWWQSVAAAPDTSAWSSVTYGNGMFVAVACGLSSTSCNATTGNRVMTSPDGINWTARTSSSNSQWQSVTYGNGLFVAVAVGGTNSVMTSSDGISWTLRSAAGNNDSWFSVTYGNGLFVAVGWGLDYIMTSSDGTTWTVRTVAQGQSWNSVTYGNGQFVAVGTPLGSYPTVMTSSNGTTWTVRSAAGDDDAWNSITYGNGQFVATGYGDGGGNGDLVMTSPDGTNWIPRTAAQWANWTSVTYGSGMFVAVSSTGNTMTSGGTALTVTGTTNISGQLSVGDTVTASRGLQVGMSSAWYNGFTRTLGVDGTGGGGSCGTKGCPVITLNDGGPGGNRWAIGVGGNGLMTIMSESGGSPTTRVSISNLGTCTLAQGGAPSCTSDARLKSVQGTATGNLAKILQLDPKYYTWNSDSSNTLHMGLIAQDVQAVLPEFVHAGEDGYLQLEYGGLVAPLIGAVQEQQAMITGLQDDINNIETLINAGTFATLQVVGDVSVGGNLTVAGNIETRNITVNGHIVTGGEVPVVATGAGAGVEDQLNNIAAPIVQIVGNDTSGTITITTGTNTLADELARVTFAAQFGNKPRIILTPANRDSAKIGAYYNDFGTTNSGFSILADIAPQSNKTYTFTYFVVQ